MAARVQALDARMALILYFYNLFHQVRQRAAHSCTYSGTYCACTCTHVFTGRSGTACGCASFYV